MIGPFVTIGLRAGDVRGAMIERDVHIGTGARIIGPVTVGAGARVGANAVVVSDVPGWRDGRRSARPAPRWVPSGTMRLLKRKERAPADLRAEIERLAASNRARPDRETERRLLALRHREGIRLLDAEAGEPAHPAPADDRLPESDTLPEIAAADVTPELLRAGILRDGCLLVRGLVGRDAALGLARGIDRSFAEREVGEGGGAGEPGYYEEFQPDPRFPPIAVREWVKMGGGVLAADSPLLSFQMLELLICTSLMNS